MRMNKSSIIVILLLSLTMTMATPIVAVHASPLSDLVTQLSTDSGGSAGNGLVNILLGLLIGKLFGNFAPSGIGDQAKVLAASTTPEKPTTDGAAIVADGRKYMGTPYVWGGGNTRRL